MAASTTLRIVPLGGLGEFGLNCTVLESGDDLLIVDAGMMFPTEDSPGVDIVVPDFSYVAEQRSRVRAVVLTHGHEDHIGALPLLAPLLDCPIYGTPLTLGLARERLREKAPGSSARLTAVRDGDRVSAGPFGIEFIPVTHSIPQAVALAISTPAGNIVHSADFKLDPTPVDGRLTAVQRLREYGDGGVRALLLDSTNAIRPGRTGSERDVGRALGPIFREAEGRLLFTCFSSNIHRLQQIFDLASAHGRQVTLLGRSLSVAVDTAIDCGALRLTPGTRCDPGRAMSLPRDRVALIASGSQGEPLSAMTRLALDTHPDASVERGDTAVICSRAVPGNEMPVARMLDHLCRRGASVLTPDGGDLHVSGHASRDELVEMIGLVRPGTLIPVHGGYRHLAECARLSEAADTPPRNVVLAETGDVVEIDGARARVSGRAPVGRVHMDAAMGEVDEMVLRDRRHLSADGILLPVLLLDRNRGAFNSPPEIVSRGFRPVETVRDMRHEIAAVVCRVIEDYGPGAAAHPSVVRTRVITELQRFVKQRTGSRPLILPVIIEV